MTRREQALHHLRQAQTEIRALEELVMAGTPLSEQILIPPLSRIFNEVGSFGVEIARDIIEKEEATNAPR